MSIPTRKVVEPSIEELAFKHLTAHPNDKRGGILARMNGRFGREATREAISNARNVLKMVDPDNPAIKLTYWERQQLRQARPITGTRAKLIIIDEYSEINP